MCSGLQLLLQHCMDIEIV